MSRDVARSRSKAMVRRYLVWLALAETRGDSDDEEWSLCDKRVELELISDDESCDRKGEDSRVSKSGGSGEDGGFDKVECCRASPECM